MANAQNETNWPQATSESRPWARWWWMGSAVDKATLTTLLEQYRAAGFGGVEICPIYGAQGAEAKFIDYLSPQWMEMLAHTTDEGRRLDFGVDFTTGTGWPYGGPQVTPEAASNKAVFKTFKVAGGAALNEKLSGGTPRAVMAFAADGKSLELTDKVQNGKLNWQAPAGKWTVYALLQSPPIQKVKRAAPGGDGWVVDPFSVKSLAGYLARFDAAFKGFKGAMPRAQFHDSFEYFGADFTPELFAQFQKRHGYDLKMQLPALLGEGPAETATRVRADYRATMGALHLAYIRRWTAWCHSKNTLSRNQAHGAPGNLLDLYAAADIPETETFRDADEKQMAVLKLASSAAHVSGKKLASAESFTWLKEHFQTSLADLKPVVDLLFTSGINHVFYHGITYSPPNATWPGWTFYAAVNFGPQGGLWRELPEFNNYVARCQSVLQSGRPANDVLLYFPQDDIWTRGEKLLPQFTMHDEEKWLRSDSVYEVATRLWQRGYGYDFVSDELLKNAAWREGAVQLGDGSYRAIVVPHCAVMSDATLSKLAELAQSGARVIVQDALPDDVPGFADVEARRDRLKTAGEKLVKVGAAIGADYEAALAVGVKREAMTDLGLRFVRRTRDGGYHYFVSNLSDVAVDGWMTLGVPTQAVLILDPRQTDRVGLAALRRQGKATQIYLQLQPGESCMLRTFNKSGVNAQAWSYLRPSGEARDVVGEWSVHFTDGGAQMPSDFTTTRLASWTELAGAKAKRFAGTATYTVRFQNPDATMCQLDLGGVGDSAHVWLNGQSLGAAWSHPFVVHSGIAMLAGENLLEVEVTNVAANRIADLDRRGVAWKNFHEINFVNRDYKPFDASQWPPRDSGLLGPVRLTPVERFTP